MKILEFLQTQNDEDKLATLLCPNEYDLDNFNQIGKCHGGYEKNCKKCWEYALDHYIW